jgi:hypothetical protein
VLSEIASGETVQKMRVPLGEDILPHVKCPHCKKPGLQLIDEDA